MIKLSSDVNDNPPEFASKYYFASIREGESVGTDVVRLMASSKDAGVNAEITYSIIGGNEGRKFMINCITRRWVNYSTVSGDQRNCPKDTSSWFWKRQSH